MDHARPLNRKGEPASRYFHMVVDGAALCGVAAPGGWEPVTVDTVSEAYDLQCAKCLAVNDRQRDQRLREIKARLLNLKRKR